MARRNLNRCAGRPLCRRASCFHFRISSALFQGTEGHYRVIVFIVNDQAFAASGETVSGEEAPAWVGAGLNRLPDSIADRPFTERHAGTAMIYQFHRVGHEQDPIANPDGAATAVRQLERSGILTALGQ